MKLFYLFLLWGVAWGCELRVRCRQCLRQSHCIYLLFENGEAECRSSWDFPSLSGIVSKAGHYKECIPLQREQVVRKKMYESTPPTTTTTARPLSSAPPPTTTTVRPSPNKRSSQAEHASDQSTTGRNNGTSSITSRMGASTSTHKRQDEIPLTRQEKPSLVSSGIVLATLSLQNISTTTGQPAVISTTRPNPVQLHTPTTTSPPHYHHANRGDDDGDHDAGKQYPTVDNGERIVTDKPINPTHPPSTTLLTNKRQSEHYPTSKDQTSPVRNGTLAAASFPISHSTTTTSTTTTTTTSQPITSISQTSSPTQSPRTPASPATVRCEKTDNRVGTTPSRRAQVATAPSTPIPIELTTDESTLILFPTTIMPNNDNVGGDDSSLFGPSTTPPILTQPRPARITFTFVERDIFAGVPLLDACTRGERRDEGRAQYLLVRSMCRLAQLSEKPFAQSLAPGTVTFFLGLNPAKFHENLCRHVLNTSRRCDQRKKVLTEMKVNWGFRSGPGSTLFKNITFSSECDVKVRKEPPHYKLARSLCVMLQRFHIVGLGSLSHYQIGYLQINPSYQHPSECEYLFQKKYQCY